MRASQRGFSLIELMLVLVIFLIVTGAIFGLLDAAQVRYRAEQDFLESFQGARLGVDQLVREIRSAGYPPPYTYPGDSVLPNNYVATYGAVSWTDPTLAPADLQRRFAIAFPGTPNQSCTVGPLGTCTVPNANNLTLELDIDPENSTCPNQVEVVDYQLQGPDAQGLYTLMRRVQSKPGNPAFSSPPCVPLAGTFTPFVENVIPNPVDPGTGQVPPLFQYICDPAVAVCTPNDIIEVIVTLTVRSSRPDIRTQQFRQITLRGAVRRLNPSP